MLAKFNSIVNFLEYILSFEITSFVGLKKKNNINDVKLLQALLNVYSRRNKSESLTITGKCDNELIDKLVEYQNKHLKISKPKEYAEPNGKIVKSLNELVRSVFKPMSTIPPKVGLLTWNAEGNEGGHITAENYMSQVKVLVLPWVEAMI